MQLEFGYGNGVQTVELPQENLLGVLHAAPILVGRECYETVRCVDSDAADCIHLGDTAHGTPVDITRAVAEADFRICLGNIEFHYFAGYPGGAPKDANLYQTQKALDAAFRKYGPSATVLAMPHGGSSTAVSAGRRPRITAGHNKLEKQPISNETGCFFQTICKFRPRRSGPCDTTSGARA